VRCRAIDNCVYIARASYGTAADVAWVSGMVPGKSCIVDFEGTILADAGPRIGVAAHSIDLDRPKVKERSFGGDVGDAAEFLRQDRRPETYGSLLER
jgi:predicted amidohydrolase